MLNEFVSSFYVGCATDHNFVMPTCVMLSSLDHNGNIPEATVIVTDFGLTDQDRVLIRKSAGQLGHAMRFVPLHRNSPEIVACPTFHFPLPLLGRFVIPGLIRKPKARLVTLDSDMIVNRTIRPLFDMCMRDYAIGAVQDPISVREHYGREPVHNYFNAGMMLIDLDRFNAQDYAGRAMRRLAGYNPPPMWLDQDALNEEVGDRWLALDRRWNYFHAADQRTFTFEDYEAANIIHFAGGKPWDGNRHPAEHLFFEHEARVLKKTMWQPVGQGGRTNRVFAASCREVLLGREPDGGSTLPDHQDISPNDFIGRIVASPDFFRWVIDPVAEGRPLSEQRFPNQPTPAQRFWMIDRLPMLEETAERLEVATDWRNLFAPLLEDRYFMRLGKLRPIKALPVMPVMPVAEGAP